MNTITLTSQGKIVQGGKLIDINPLRLLSAAVELEEDYTLRSLFRLLRAHPILAELNEFIPALLDREEKAPKAGCTTGKVERLEVARTVEMIGFPGKPRMELYVSFYGVAGGEPTEIRFIQVEDLLDTPLRLGRLRHVVLGDSADIFEFETVFNLFEFIEGVTWELSFHGTPMQCSIGR